MHIAEEWEVQTEQFVWLVWDRRHWEPLFTEGDGKGQRFCRISPGTSDHLASSEAVCAFFAAVSSVGKGSAPSPWGFPSALSQGRTGHWEWPVRLSMSLDVAVDGGGRIEQDHLEPFLGLRWRTSEVSLLFVPQGHEL